MPTHVARAPPNDTKSDAGVHDNVCCDDFVGVHTRRASLPTMPATSPWMDKTL